MFYACNYIHYQTTTKKNAKHVSWLNSFINNQAKISFKLIQIKLISTSINLGKCHTYHKIMPFLNNILTHHILFVHFKIITELTFIPIHIYVNIHILSTIHNLNYTDTLIHKISVKIAWNTKEYCPVLLHTSATLDLDHRD